MSSKPWIEVVPVERAEGLLRRLFDAAIGRAGKVFNIVQIMSLRPQQTRASMDLYREVMFAPSELGRDEREMVATVVSRVNECFY
ncbi:MAG: carboxymuconolactone decarboxylase family protein [Planctomycetota bacterium]